MCKSRSIIAGVMTIAILRNLELTAVVAQSAPPQSPIQTRVYLRKQCLLSQSDVIPPPPGPEVLPALAAIFIPLLIERLLGGVGGALKKAGSEQTLKDSGRRPTYLYHLIKRDGKQKVQQNPDLGCVIVVRGRFTAPDDDQPAPLKFSNKGVFAATNDADEQQRISRLNENMIPVKEIAVAYEANITTSDDKTALLYESRFLEVRKFQGTRSTDSRALVISIGIVGAGDKEGEPVLSLALMNLGDVTVHQDKKKEKSTYTLLGPDQVKGRRSSWLGGIGLNETSLKALEKMEVTTEPFKGVMPASFEGTVIETEDGNAALKFIGEVLDSTKGDVAKALSQEILKDRSKEATEAADALEKLTQEERTAYGEYLTAIAAAAKAGLSNEEKAAADFEVKRKKGLWCGKYLSLGKLGQAPTDRQCTASDLKQ